MLQELWLKITIGWTDCNWSPKECFVWKWYQPILLNIPFLVLGCPMNPDMLRIRTLSRCSSKMVCSNSLFLCCCADFYLSSKHFFKILIKDVRMYFTTKHYMMIDPTVKQCTYECHICLFGPVCVMLCIVAKRYILRQQCLNI